jgi:sensor histidine kinase YesM
MKIFQKLYPLFLGVVSFNILRLITDIPNHDPFWTGGILLHLTSLIATILSYYLFDFLVRLSIKNRWFVRKNHFDIIKEYTFVILFQLAGINLLLYWGEKAGIFYFGNPVRDYLIANIVNLPLYILYYTALNRETIETEYREQLMLVEKMKVEKLESELKLLQSQYRPHFLFNALNTVYFQVNSENREAKQTIEQLSDLLRYQLYNINQEVTLEQEINYLTNYIEFQKQRMPDCLKLQFNLNVQNKEQKIHPLLFQPLLENAFKYVGGDYRIDIEMKQSGNELVFKIANSIPENGITHSKKGGIGLINLQRRLDLLYSNKYVLKTEKREHLYNVLLSLELT